MPLHSISVNYVQAFEMQLDLMRQNMCLDTTDNKGGLAATRASQSQSEVHCCTTFANQVLELPDASHQGLVNDRFSKSRHIQAQSN